MSQIQLHRIDLNLLATFEALIEEGTVAGAADRLAVTPSAVSHALGRLRTQFGDPLLVRVGGKMRPTPGRCCSPMSLRQYCGACAAR